jgi:PPM family protein phosphatase
MIAGRNYYLTSPYEISSVIARITYMPITLNLLVSSLTEKGGRSRNEDAVGISSNAAKHCFALSDGAGGHGGGHVAAQTAIRSCLEAFTNLSKCSRDTALALICSANTDVLSHQAQGAELEDMHATLVLLLIDTVACKAVWGHIGDSRLYHFRNNQLLSRTKDHSVFQAMQEAGLIRPDSTRANNPSLNALTQCLGQADHFSPTIIESECDLSFGDAFLICSDGLWEYVNEGEIVQALQQAESPDQWLANMHSVLLKNKIDGNDNYSAVAVWLSK